MTLENAKVLYKNLMDAGREGAADNLLTRYPELAQETKEKDKDKPKKEAVKKSVNRPKR